MAAVYSLIPNGKPEPLARINVKNEDEELQAVLEKNPALLPGEQIDPEEPRRWLIVKREMPVPDPTSGFDHWYLDFLLADQDAVPTFVECKRFDDTGARRKVVGQVLDYAANGQYYWTKEDLRSWADETARKRDPSSSLEKALGGFDPAPDLSSVELFIDRFYANLQEGQVRIIFFLDKSPLELRSIADFLNKQMERAEVLVVEARQYEHKDAKIIVPVLIGYTDEIRRGKKKVTVTQSGERGVLTMSALIEKIQKSNSPEDAALAKEIIGRLEGLGLTTRSLPSSINFGVEVNGDFLAAVSSYDRSISINIPYKAARKMGPEKMTQFKKRFNAIAGFYRPDSLDDTTNRGQLFPHFDRLEGKVDSLIDAISDLRNELIGLE